MSTRDSGLIDLFAIHKEEEAKQASVMPSAPPPAVAFDIAPPASVSSDDIEDFAEISRRASRKRMKIIGGVVGAAAVIGIMAFAITTGVGKSAPAPAAAAAAPPPPTATFVPPPPPAPEPSPAPPPTAASKDAKSDGKSDANGGYTRAAAVAAYNAQQGKKTKAANVGVKAAPKASGPKMQKVQSSGVEGGQ